MSDAPRQVLLFSGHMVDAPDRDPPRFPESAVARAGERIADALRTLGVGSEDLAYTQGACGGDLLFTEACQSLGVPVQWMQPFDEDEFIQRSVALRGEHWSARYQAARAQLDRPVRSMRAQLGRTAGDPFERCNQWLLERALAHGVDRLRVIALWNGQGGDGPGSTAHLMQLVRSLGRAPVWIDTRRLVTDGP